MQYSYEFHKTNAVLQEIAYDKVNTCGLVALTSFEGLGISEQRIFRSYITKMDKIVGRRTGKSEEVNFRTMRNV